MVIPDDFARRFTSVSTPYRLVQVNNVDMRCQSVYPFDMDISHKLCEVRDREYEGVTGRMALDWKVYQPTLYRWLQRVRVPDATWYDFLSDKLGLSIAEVHRLCQTQRRERRGEAVRTSS